MTALGVSLLVIGALVILLEAHAPSMGLLGGPGVVLLVLGSVLAILGLGGGIAVTLATALLLGAAGGAAVLVSVREGMAVRRRRIRTGGEGLIGHLGVVRTWEDSAGKVQVDGALWQARLSWPADEDPQPNLHTGDSVVVERLNGLTLCVRRAEEWELTA
jgi:membrane-bound ClpP family serine protease